MVLIAVLTIWYFWRKKSHSGKFLCNYTTFTLSVSFQ